MVEPVRHRQTKEAGTDMLEPKATAPHLDSTATTFVIIHSRSRPDRRGGHGSSGMQGGRRIRLLASGQAPSRMTGGYLVPTKHPETPLACALSSREWASSSISKGKSPLGIFAINLGQEFESLRARQISTIQNKTSNPPSTINAGRDFSRAPFEPLSRSDDVFWLPTDADPGQIYIYTLCKCKY
jgi:hypothetical protein